MNNQASINAMNLQVALVEWSAQSCEPLGEPPSQDFLAKARLGARKAETFRKLRTAAGRLGFKPRSLPDYLAEVARAAGVSLGALLPAMREGASPVSPWIALARDIGLDTGLIELLARVWIAVRHVEGDAAPVMARRSPVRSADPVMALVTSADEAALESRLRSIERAYPPAARRLLKNILAEIK